MHPSRISTFLFLGFGLASRLVWGQAADQRRHDVELALTYSPQYTNILHGPHFWQQGATLELADNVFMGSSRHGAGWVVNVGRYQGRHITSDGESIDLTMGAVGLRYAFEADGGRVRLFAQQLLGVARGTSNVDAFPNPPNGYRSASNSVVLQTGAGIDIRMSDRFTLRPLQMDWLRTEFNNAESDYQNIYRFSIGVALKLN